MRVLRKRLKSIGELPAPVSAAPGPDVPVGERDPMLIIFQTAGGPLVDIEVFMTARYGYEVRCQVVAGNGMLDMGDGGFITRTNDGVRGQAIPELWLGRFGEAYRLQMQAWIDAVRGETGPVGASLWDGFAATTAAQSAVDSLTSGGWEPIDLPPRPALYS